MPLLKLDNVSVGYEKHIVADKISLTLEHGDYLCIVGENGAGKSTLMKTLLSLIPPMGGKIEFESGFTKNMVGYLPQQTDVQKDFPATVWEVVLSGCLNGSGARLFYTREQKATAEKWIKRLEIEPLKKHSYRALSGGQQQRVLLARALCAAKGLIVLDEPVTGLDPIMSKNMYDLISSINKENKITVIMVSHDISAAIKYSSHILQITKEGSVFAPTAQYLKSDEGRFFVESAGGNDA